MDQPVSMEDRLRKLLASKLASAAKTTCKILVRVLLRPLPCSQQIVRSHETGQAKDEKRTNSISENQ